ncbi:MAG: hypothetical protein JO180_11665 [Gemmatirosa sp.]|nr:hypothetical protein [Gemmatirosa sp.]
MSRFVMYQDAASSPGDAYRASYRHASPQGGGRQNVRAIAFADFPPPAEPTSPSTVPAVPQADGEP